MDKLGEGLSARWLEHLFSPALLFWSGGLLMVGLRMGYEASWAQLKDLDVNAQIALVLAGLLLVVLSSKLMEELRFFFLRLLEGYWRAPLAWLAGPLRRWQWRRIEKGRNRWNELMIRREKGPLTYAEARELARGWKPMGTMPLLRWNSACLLPWATSCALPKRPLGNTTGWTPSSAGLDCGCSCPKRSARCWASHATLSICGSSFGSGACSSWAGLSSGPGRPSSPWAGCGWPTPWRGIRLAPMLTCSNRPSTCTAGSFTRPQVGKNRSSPAKRKSPWASASLSSSGEERVPSRSCTNSLLLRKVAPPSRLDATEGFSFPQKPILSDGKVLSSSDGMSIPPTTLDDFSSHAALHDRSMTRLREVRAVALTVASSMNTSSQVLLIQKPQHARRTNNKTQDMKHLFLITLFSLLLNPCDANHTGRGNTCAAVH